MSSTLADEIYVGTAPASPDQGPRHRWWTDLDVHMAKVRKSSDANGAHAGSATASAFVSYQDLSDALGIEVKAGSAPGHITATVMAPMVGQLTVNARVVKGGPASIAFKDVSVASDQLP
ncbi:hypothetical protein [Actinacidiphila soli]|uniref:hypothetical protein n=1 Tax=Actinacidiphila soli TaxID=2487275 RepID=UPI000FCADA24|nr:hypothetical protein [Actinacidiphila soli]